MPVTVPGPGEIESDKGQILRPGGKGGIRPAGRGEGGVTSCSRLAPHENHPGLFTELALPPKAF